MDKIIKNIQDIVASNFNSTCPKCGIRFNCAVKTGQGDCWCLREKAGKTIQNLEHQDCLCKRCLTKG